MGHCLSLGEFEQQALPENDKTFPVNTLLKLDQSCVHRVAEANEQLMRLFIKISISPDKYNLKDNSRNYDLEYNWKQHERAVVRNNPATAQRDSVVDDHFA